VTPGDGTVTTGEDGVVRTGGDGGITPAVDGGTVDVTRTPVGVTSATGVPSGDDVEVVAATAIGGFDSANCVERSTT
jgi:hypothetical protein